MKADLLKWTGWLTRERGGGASLGRRGERAAARCLKRQGYRLLARNLRSRVGEIDLLALAPDRRTVAVVEVKAGTHADMPPELHVNAAKQRKVAAVAAHLARTHGLADHPLRFDVVAVEFDAAGQVEIRHHPGAFESPM